MKFGDRDAVQIENERVRVTVLKEGGHVAELLEKRSGINPLWVPPWKSIEPSTYDAARHAEYGGNSESKLLAGIMGHNLCLDMFGPPSKEEAEAGLSVHGEGSVVPYELAAGDGEIHASAYLPLAGLQFERAIRLEGHTIHFAETVENLSALDRPIAWTQHVTLGPPFIENGVARAAYSEADAEPVMFSDEASSGGFTTHLMDKSVEQAYFTAWNPVLNVFLSYHWRREDFPWLGIWEENRSRKDPPWDGRTLTWGMEFGVSPYPETRREMIERGRTLGVPGFRWLAARERVTVKYSAQVSAEG